jgi:hypothetical protein
VVLKRASIPLTLVHGEDMSEQYVAMSVTNLSSSEGQDGFGVFTIVNDIIVLIKGVSRNWP